ncbi:hypothetical protein [uncultured Helicobacter sp.]|uniref:S6 family peptidase n=1 Tax=uncultured Helicobacter sp. TaxID=175537 RepID=UPI003750D39D
MKLDAVGDPFTLAMVAYDWRNGNLRIPFGSSSAPGDSSSALYVYDNLDKKWYAVGVVSQSNCDGNYETLCSQVQYTLINDELIEELKEPKSVFIGSGAYRFDSAGKLLDSNGGDLGAHTILDSVAGENL